ncbi:MAG TPA: dihydrolipoamide acetyltransferase family protein [Candidatus Tyrphobacter sp.]
MTTITMPQLGETVTEGTVAQWLKRVGESVEKYEPFVEVSTDKVNAEVPSPVSGVIREVLVKEGETVATGTPIAIIDDVSSGTAPIEQASPAATKAEANRMAGDEPVPGFAPVPSAPPRSNGQPAVAAPSAPLDETLRTASPAVRRLAREHNVDIRAVKGTGNAGRVTARDVTTAAAAGPAIATGPARPAPSGTSTYGEPIPGTTIPFTQARRIIAQRMVESKQTAPHAWSTVEVDVTNLWRWREREKAHFERETGYKLTLLPFFIRAVVQALQAFPLVNARFTPEGIQVLKEINIGIAIGLPANLIVPVVKGADRLTIKALGVAAGELIDKARRNKLGVDDLAGGTFTVNNTGANGSVLSAPIINGGQAAIVTMEAIVKRPVVRGDDAIAIRHMMNSCLSIDHRVLDGYSASGFLAELKRRLESMGPDGAL